jgi:hypothetical protein
MTVTIPKNQDQLDLHYLYWIPKLHKNPCKQRYIAGSSKCSTKSLSLLLTKIGPNSAPLLADLFLYSYEAEFVQKQVQDNNKKLAVSFNHTFRYCPIRKQS